MTWRRIALVGPVASGKSTLASAVSAATGLRHVDLDGLFWGPGWTPVPDRLFTARVREAIAAEEWIAEGNHTGPVAGELLDRAELTIWLDLPLRVCLPRLLARSIRRAATGEELFGGNRETFGHLLGRDSILWWGPAHHRRHRRRWAALIGETDGRMPVLRLGRAPSVVPVLRAAGLLGPGGEPWAG